MANFTTVNKPGLHFNTNLYTGNGSTQHSITGVGFQPDFTWIKSRDDAYNHFLFDAVRGVGKQFYSNTTAAEGTNMDNLYSFNADGFSLAQSGNDDVTNKNNSNFVSWNWKAAGGSGSSNTDGTINTISTSVNTTAGFSITSWVGSGANATVGHGLGAAPELILLKNRSEVYGWQTYWKVLGSNKYLALNSTDAEATSTQSWNNTAPTSTVFSVGASDSNNKSGNNIVAYCFKEKRGYSKFGTYKGNGNANGTFVHTGFKPAWLLVKRAVGGTQDWQQFDNKINPRNVAAICMRPNQNNGEQTGNAMDFLSNGFKNRLSGSSVNTADNTYVYMAFAEEPLVGTNNVCSTAR